MITRNARLALLCFFVSVKLTSSAEFYLLKVIKAPVTVARNENDKETLLLKILPLAKSLKKVYEKAKTDKEDGFPCRPGQICIGKVQHSQNSVVFNNGLRDPSVLPPNSYLNFLDDTTDTDEYIELNDEYSPFIDLTRFEKVNKQKREIKRKNAKETFSTDYLDINDWLRSENKNVSQNYRKADAVMVETQGKQYMRVDSRDYSASSDEKETIEVKHKKIIPKRFEVVHNHNKKKVTSDSSSETKSELDDLESFEPITTQRPKHKKKNVDNFEDVQVKDEFYIQRPGKYIKLGASSEEYFRRRLEHFLPKRYHWDGNEITKLGYYWFNGPQGKYPSPWRISY